MNEGLTAKQEKFAQAVASGKSQSDAYREAYDASRTKDSVIWSKASDLMTNGKVKERIQFLKLELSKSYLWTREDSVRELTSVINDMTAKCSDRTAAVKVLNEMHGFNAPVKHDITGDIVHEIRRTIVSP